MKKEELIEYIRENDTFYSKVNLEDRSEAELRRLKELVEALKNNERKLRDKTKM